MWFRRILDFLAVRVLVVTGFEPPHGKMRSALLVGVPPGDSEPDRQTDSGSSAEGLG